MWNVTIVIYVENENRGHFEAKLHVPAPFVLYAHGVIVTNSIWFPLRPGGSVVRSTGEAAK